MSDIDASGQDSLASRGPVSTVPSSTGPTEIVTIVLPPEKMGDVERFADRFSLIKADPPVLVTFGEEAIGSFGA
ncbi:MAG: Toxic anion resistance protein (TelA), partial [Rhizobiaceae bacterium]|nr:Toxic anion resistance protein (TelA) [Rhizobiaceae bacterium]